MQPIINKAEKAGSETESVIIEGVGGRDVFLLSYPRSGNTWLRLLLCDIYYQLMGYETAGKEFLVDKFESVSPALEKHDLSLVPRPALGHFLVKTHQAFVAKRHSFIYIYRSPLDAIASYHVFLNSSGRHYLPDDYERFCLEQTEAWKAHVEQALANRENGFFVNYANLVARPQEVLKSLRHPTHLRYRKKNIEKALATWPPRPSGVRSIRMSEELTSYIESSTKPLFDKLSRLNGYPPFRLALRLHKRYFGS
jgi:hypothetical protein